MFVDAMGVAVGVAERFAAVSLPEVPDARLEEEFADLQRGIDALEAERLRWLAEVARRGLFERDGHLSAASWLVARFRMSWGQAKELVRIAKALERMPVARDALAGGRITTSAVRVLVGAHDANPGAYERTEEALVEAARIHCVRDLQRVVAYWREAADVREAPAEDDLLRRRHLHASATLQGMVRVDGLLDPETGESFLTALRAIQDAETRSDGDDGSRTPSQRRNDALGELSRQWLDLAERPTIAGERPHVTLTVAVDGLIAGSRGWADTRIARLHPRRVSP